jgi:thymidylate synthase (FAD)
MKIVSQSYEILTPISDGGIKELQDIERVARTCYKSEDNIVPDGSSALKLVKRLQESKHEAMLEHSFLSVKFITDRGISHEIVRHRLFSYAQESQRYCNYSKDKFDKNITFIKPPFFEKGTDEYIVWADACYHAEKAYFAMLSFGATPQEARSVLPNSTKTEIVVSGNYREWAHFFRLRTAPDAHPQMVALMQPLKEELQSKIPIIFD